MSFERIASKRIASSSVLKQRAPECRDDERERAPHAQSSYNDLLSGRFGAGSQTITAARRSPHTNDFLLRLFSCEFFSRAYLAYLVRGARCLVRRRAPTSHFRSRAVATWSTAIKGKLAASSPYVRKMPGRNLHMAVTLVSGRPRRQEVPIYRREGGDVQLICAAPATALS